MNKSKLSIVCLILCFSATMSLSAQSLNLKIQNELDVERPGEIVEVKLVDVVYLLPEGDIQKLGIVNKSTGERLPSQLVDSDLDGEIDLFIFQDNFTNKGMNEYELKYFEVLENIVHKVYVTFIEGREDIAWENDKVAYRMYGPPLAESVDNGIDVWSKKVDYLIIDKWYKEEEEGKSYHKDHGEGADFFSVGKSLGCGGSAIMLNDSLYQSGVYTNYRIIANGPLRLMFELEYVNFSAGNKMVTEKKVVTLDAGSYLNKIESSYSVVPEKSRFTTGVVKRANTTVTADFGNSIVSLWGDNTKKKEDGLVGTAAILPETDSQQIIEDEQHILITSFFYENRAQVHYTGACWSSAGVITSAADWNKYLSEFDAKLKSPLRIEILK